MTTRKIGINTDFIGQEISFEEGYRAVKEAGFEAVFVCDFIEETTERHIVAAKAEGLCFDTLHADWATINNMWSEGDEGERFLEKMKATVALCTKHHIPTVIVHLSSGENPPHVNEKGASRFHMLVAEAANKGVKIAFENQRKLDHLAYFMEYYRQSETVGFCWDTGHESCFTMGKIDFMSLYGERLCALHIHDNNKIYNDDAHLIPFDAQIDFSRVAQKIRESGYEGTLMLELKRHAYAHLSVKDFLRRAYLAAAKLRNMIDG